MRFDLTDLRLFLHVVEAGSITAGADRAHLALASASARIRGMEDELGAPLFERVRHGIEPTPLVKPWSTTPGRSWATWPTCGVPLANVREVCR